MKQRAGNSPLKLRILALPETTPMSVYGLFEIFSSVGLVWSRLTGEPVDVRRIAPKIVAKRREQFMCSVGVPIAPHSSTDDREIADIVIVTDITLPIDDETPAKWRKEIRWLRRQLAAGAHICSVCTGAIVLAEAGLLDEAEVASHWSAAAIFRDRYPQIRFHPERILCNSGRNGRIITTGGASSWEDLALHLIARHCGHEEAVRIAKVFVLGDRSDGQLPFAVMMRPKLHTDAIIKDSQSWLARHSSISNPVARMVQRSGLPERTFKRRFKAATGYAPVEYVQSVRIERAKQLLEQRSDSIEKIAAATGYEDPAFFRRLFKRRAGVTPGDYRRRYQRGAKSFC